MTQKTKKKFSSAKIFLGISIIILSLIWLGLRNTKSELSGVQITSNKEASVEINGSYVGKTPYYSENINPGSAEVRITEKTSGQTWKEKIKLVEGSLTTVHRDFGDLEYKSSGYMLNLVEDSTGSASVNITSIPQHTSVLVDDKPFGFTPFNSNLEMGEHVFKFSSPGFEDKEIHADIPQGYKLDIAFSLASVGQPTMDKETVVTIGKNEVVITPTYIEINPMLEMFDEKPLRLDQNNFPLIFNVDKEFTRINVKDFSGGGTPDTKLIYISGQIPNHGTYADNYYVIIDPEINKYVEDGYNYLFGNVHINNSCTNCALPGLLFKEYSKKDQTFILSNNKHRKEFIELLKLYEQYERKEICRIDKKDYLLVEALKTAKNTDRCADLGMGGMYPDASNDSFIILGEYKQIKENIKSIIRGENIPMFSRGYHGEGLSPLVRWMVNENDEIYFMSIDSKENYFDQESIDGALSWTIIGNRIKNNEY